MNQVCIQSCGTNKAKKLTSAQHYEAKHSFECSQCNRKFDTKKSMDQVSLLAMRFAPTIR